MPRTVVFHLATILLSCHATTIHPLLLMTLKTARIQYMLPEHDMTCIVKMLRYEMYGLSVSVICGKVQG